MLWDALSKGVQAITRGGYAYALHGGLAVAIHARPRPTADVDLICLVGNRVPSGLLLGLEAEGLKPEAGPALTSGPLIVLIDQSTGVEVAVSLGLHPFEAKMVHGAISTDTPSGLVQVVTPADLIVTRFVAGRPQDVEDASAILDAHPDLDRELALRAAEELAQELGLPEIAHRAKACLGL